MLIKDKPTHCHAKPNPFFLMCFSLAIPILAAAQHAGHLDISDYEWKNRLLLVFAPSEESDLYQGQIRELETNKEGLNDRDMKVFHLLEAGTSHVEDQPIGREEVRRLLKDYKVSAGDFAVILVGKDGTEKLRTDSILTTDRLFAVIDAMPMRRREMKQ